MAALSDNELWDILGKEPLTLPGEEWNASAKAALSGGSVFPSDPDGMIHFFCRVLQVATDYYTNYAGQDGVFREETARQIFEGALAASGLMPWHERNRNVSIIDIAEQRSFIAIETIRGRREEDGRHCKLTFSGKKRASEPPVRPEQAAAWRPRVSAPAPWEVDPEGWGVSVKAAAQANAQADVINAPTFNNAPVAKTGDIHQEVTVKPLDLSPLAEAERIRQEHETKRLAMTEEHQTKRLEMALAVGAGKAPEPKRTPDTVDDMTGYMSPADLAKKYEKPLSAVKTKLTRYKNENDSVCVEVHNRGAREPGFLYLESAVRDVIISIKEKK